MAKISQVLQTPSFKKTVKKLHKNQKKDLDAAIRVLMEDPTIGEQKKGDLAFLRVYKFKMVKQLTLLGYSYVDGLVTLELIAQAFSRSANQQSAWLFLQRKPVIELKLRN